MIGYLKGRVIALDAAGVVVLCGSVGYTVFPVGCLLEKGEDVELWIHDVVREDRRDLYGFIDTETKLLFEQLITIDGVGQKLAQRVLNSTNATALRRHILDGNIEFLTSLSGVGKKTAQKIILEMKGILVEDSAPQGSVAQEVIEGLKSLGYTMQDLKPYLVDLPQDTEGAIKEVLKRFAKRSGM